MYIGLDPELKSELDALSEIVTAAGRLPRGVEPERDLWPGVEARLRSEKVVKGDFGFSRRTWLAVAAMVSMDWRWVS